MSKIKIAIFVLLFSFILQGCSSSQETVESSESVITTESTSAESTENAEESEDTTTEESTETTTESTADTEVATEESTENSTANQSSSPCDNIGLTLDEAIEKFGAEPEYSMFAEPPRTSTNFNDGALYGVSDEDGKIIEAVFNEFYSYSGDILPNLKLGMSFDEISKNYSLSEPSTDNLNGTYCSYFNVNYNGNNLNVTVDFGDDENCSSVGYIVVFMGES